MYTCIYVHVHIYLYFFHQQPFILISQRGEQDQAVGAVCECESTVSSVCVDLCCWLRAYVCSVCECVHIRTCAYWEYMLSRIMGWTW